MTDKVIHVNVTSTKSQRVSVSPGNVQNEITATPDSSQYYSNLAKNWAIASGLILNEDYSSKHYAKESANSASSAKNYADATQATYQNVQNVANEALTDIETARVDAVDNITTVKSESIASVEAKGNEASTLVNTGIANINTAKTEAVNAVTTTKNNAVTEINKEVTDGKKELNDIIEAGGLNINDKITNCLLEVPQNIKLELNNGTLTLKAGSKVIVPNGKNADGSNRFDEVVIKSDITSAFGNGVQKMVFLNPNKTSINNATVSTQTSSGASNTSTSSYVFWYDTTNNFVKFSSNSGSTWTNGFSLPICLVNGNDNVVTSINQVFNGFGYIGSTIWITSGIEGLFPWGRNEDGTLNNIQKKTTKVVIKTNASTYTRTNYNLVLDNNNGIALGGYIEYDGVPTSVLGNVNWILNKQDNRVYQWDGSKYALKAEGLIKLATNVNIVNGVIQSMTPCQPFRAVDYNDFNKSITALSKAYITETYVSGTSWYRVWSDGWKEQGGTYDNGSVVRDKYGINVTFLKAFKDANYIITPFAYKNDNAPEYRTAVANVYYKTATQATMGWYGTDGNQKVRYLNWYACGY